MSRKNKCRGCVWGTRLNEITAFCPFRQCIKKGGGSDGDDDTLTHTAGEPDPEPVGG